MEKKEKDTENSEDQEISLFDYLLVLAKRKKLIISITLPVAIITFVLTLFNHYFFVAGTSILPPLQEDSRLANQFMREFGVFPGMGGIGRNVHSKQELLVEIMKSRTFTDRMMERFRLKENYGAEDTEEAREMFLENITIEPDFTDEKSFKLLQKRQSPLTRIYVIDQNPERAANIANAIVEELKVFVNSLAISEAAQRRLFFEEQLKQARDDLIKSEEDIKMFQEKTGILKVETQTAMVIEKIANLEAQITAKEVELQVMKSYSTASNPDFQRVEETIKGIKKELAKLETNENHKKNLLIPTGTIPALGLEYKRRYRDLKFNETLYEIMIKQYEVAKIDEAKDSALIQVIDKAVPPEKPSQVRILGRKKALAATFFSFFFSCFLAFFMERSSKNKEQSERFETLKRYLSFKRKD